MNEKVKAVAASILCYRTLHVGLALAYAAAYVGLNKEIVDLITALCYLLFVFCNR